MSVTFALIPLALAVAAHRSAREKAADAGHGVVAMSTRMRDPELLARALADMGCDVTAEDAGALVARRDGNAVTFGRSDDDVLHAHAADDADPATIQAFLEELDDEYTRLVQELVYRRLVDRAAGAGMAVAGERVDADNAIVVTLRVYE